jgi:hypothetical protein
MNRLTRGRALVGALSIDAQDITISDDLAVGGDSAVTGNSVVSGDSRIVGTFSVTRSAGTIADGASMVASASDIINNTVASATPTAARNVTTVTAEAIIAGHPLTYAVGDTTEFTLINLAAATHALTLLGGTGVTIVGSAIVSAASSATWYVRIASATTVVLYRK